jgi:hypothetical protein
VTRLAVLESTVKQLYGTATVCAHPDCAEPLLRRVPDLDTPVLNSRIAHIAAASAGGPRYDTTMTDEDRRAFDNLVLLCLPHAEEVDLTALADRYPSETLKAWKAEQLKSAPATKPTLPEVVLERAVFLSMGDVLMDFRESTVDLGGTAALAPGAGGSGGGAIGPGARGGDGGEGGDHYEFSVTGAQVLGEVPIEVGPGGRAGIGDSPGEAGGHTRFGNVLVPGAGREIHDRFPEALDERVTTSVSSALFTRHAEIANGLAYLSGAGWSKYIADELPAAFTAVLCVWLDLSWTDLEPNAKFSLEMIAELVTPTKTATFSEKSEQAITVAESSGFVRLPFLFGLAGTLHDAGLHILNVTTNTGAQLGQYLDVVVNSPSETEGPPDQDEA